MSQTVPPDFLLDTRGNTQEVGAFVVAGLGWLLQRAAGTLPALLATVAETVASFGVDAPVGAGVPALLDQRTGEPIVNFKFNIRGAQRFGQARIGI